MDEEPGSERPAGEDAPPAADGGEGRPAGQGELPAADGDEAAGGRESRGRGAWVPTVGPEDAAGDLAEAYGQIGARGRVANVIGVHSLHPEAMKGHVELYRTLMFGASPLSRRERESIAVVVSATNGCFY